MAELNFDVQKIMEQAIQEGLEEMKSGFTRDIDDLARPFGETPKITFVSNGPKSFETKIEVNSDELRAKIDDYLEERYR
jgi:hypothetical protein